MAMLRLNEWCRTHLWDVFMLDKPSFGALNHHPVMWVGIWHTFHQLALRSGFQNPAAPSYLVSLVHALYISPRGVQHLIDYQDASLEEQYAVQGNECREVMYTNNAFAGYLIHDLIQVLRVYPGGGGLDILIHHALFLGCSYTASKHRIMLLSFTWLITGEISSIFNNLRWLALHSTVARPRLVKLFSLLFAVSFLVTRVLLSGAGIMHIIRNRKFVYNREHHADRLPAIYAISAAIAVGYSLNLFWFSKILRLALSNKV